MRREKARALVGRCVRRALLPIGIFDLSVIYAKDLAEPLEPFSARVDFEVGLAEEPDIATICRMSPFHDAGVLTRRLRAGHKCFLARVGGEIVGFDWLTFDAAADEYYRIALDPRDVYCMDAFTAQAHRGKAIHTALLHYMLRFAQENGYRRAYTRVSAMHQSSWKSHLRLGWREVGTTCLFRPVFPHKAPRVLLGPKIYPVEPTFDNAAAA